VGEKGFDSPAGRHDIVAESVRSGAPVTSMLPDGWMRGPAMIDERPSMSTADGFVSDWWDVDREILTCLQDHGLMSVSEIAKRVHLSEGEAMSLLAMLAREGRVRICQVTLAS
jgi:hypothetical protein